MKRILSVLLAIIILIVPFSAEASARAEISKTTASFTKVIVKTKKVKGAKRYQVKYSLNKDFSNAKTKTSKSPKITIRGLKTNQRIYLKVRYKKRSYSKWSASKSVKTKKKIARSVDAVAKALKLKNGDEQWYQMIDAIDGKGYGDGDNAVEIYEYEKGSQAYKDMINGKMYITCDGYNNGFVIIFPNKVNKKLLKKFKQLKIKD